MLLPGNGFRDFLEQDARLEHAGLDMLEEKRPADDVAEVQVGRLLHGVEDDPELRAKLGTRAGLIDRTEDPFPKTTPNRQNRIVLDNQLPVTSREGNFRARQLPLNLPGCDPPASS